MVEEWKWKMTAEKRDEGKTAIIYPIEWMSIHEHKVNPIILHYFICLLFMYAYVCMCVCLFQPYKK